MLPRQIRRNTPHPNSNKSMPDPLPHRQPPHDILRLVNGDSEPDPFGVSSDACVYADYFTEGVAEGASAVAGVNGGVGLNEVDLSVGNADGLGGA